MDISTDRAIARYRCTPGSDAIEDCVLPAAHRNNNISTRINAPQRPSEEKPMKHQTTYPRQQPPPSTTPQTPIRAIPPSRGRLLRIPREPRATAEGRARWAPPPETSLTRRILGRTISPSRTLPLTRLFRPSGTIPPTHRRPRSTRSIHCERRLRGTSPKSSPRRTSTHKRRGGLPSQHDGSLRQGSQSAGFPQPRGQCPTVLAIRSRYAFSSSSPRICLGITFFMIQRL